MLTVDDIINQFAEQPCTGSKSEADEIDPFFVQLHSTGRIKMPGFSITVLKGN